MVVVQSKVFSFSLRPGQWDYLGLRGLRSRARVFQRVHRSEAQTLDGGCLQAQNQDHLGEGKRATSMVLRSVIPKVVWAPPTSPGFYPHSEWAALGPVQFGVRFQARVHHRGDLPNRASFSASIRSLR
jgi:hypothetical protein